MNQHVPSSRNFRLGRVKPQAPGNRTIFCNDRQANHLARFKVRFLHYNALFVRYLYFFVLLLHRCYYSLLHYYFMMIMKNVSIYERV
jgi:phospholipid-transporting ATPase